MNRLRLRCAAATILGLAANAVMAGQGQAPARPEIATGLLAGQVVDADTGRAVPEAVVTLSPASAPAAALLSPPARESLARRVISSAGGRFAFAGLTSGRYSLTVVKPGYTPGSYGKLVPRGPGSVIELRDGERLTDAKVLVWKRAVITGRVLDEAGEPVVGASVKVLRITRSGGRPSLIEAATATTDDRGIYRVASLDPGQYVVGVPATATTLPAPLIAEYSKATGPARAEMQQALFAAAPTMTSDSGSSHLQVGEHLIQVQGRMVPPPFRAPTEPLTIYPSVFFPLARQPSGGEAIVLRSGEVRPAVDLLLRPVATVRISGRLAGPEGPVGIAAIHLLPAAPEAGGAADRTPVATGVATASGDFTLFGIPAGEYVIRVLKLPSSTPRPAQMTVVQTPAGEVARGVGGGPAEVSRLPTWWASQNVTVGNQDLTDLRIALQEGFRVSGVIAVEGGPPTVPLERLGPYFDPADSWLSATLPDLSVAADGSFTSLQMPAGRYRLAVPLPAGWHLKSVRMADREIGDLPFDLTRDLSGVVVTLSNRGARVFGTVRTASSSPDSGASVVVFPTDTRQWIDFGAYPRGIKDTRTARDGAFVIDDLPAGEYFVVALSQQAADWAQAGFLETLSRHATRVVLGEGEQRAIDLRTAMVK